MPVTDLALIVTTQNSDTRSVIYDSNRTSGYTRLDGAGFFFVFFSETIWLQVGLSIGVASYRTGVQ